jgi:membrane associated rhomboid family serine protease
MFIFVLLVLGGFAVYVMSPEERRRWLGGAVSALRSMVEVGRQVHVQCSPFHDALRERTRLPVFTAAIVLLNVLMFFQMAFADGSVSDPETLVAWGASVGPRTTHGEWWRLLTSLFVHGGMLHLLMDLVGLIMVGLLVERLAGPLAVATVYVGSGVVANAASLTADPMAVNTGACGAIFGIYGMFIAAGIWGLLQPSPMTVPLTAVKSLLPSTVIFVLYSLATGELSGARAPHGLMMGLVSGLALTAGAGVRKPPALRSGIALAVTLVIGAVFAVPQRGYLDVKPEIARLMAFESRTAEAYDKAVEQFKLGGINADALARVIDRTIRPELQSVRLRLKSLERVPEKHQSIVASAEEYLRLRDESWRLRAEGLHAGNMLTLRKADRTEGASLDVLETIKVSSDQ